VPYGYRDDEWIDARMAARRLLVARAAVGETITYAELTATPLGHIAFRPDDPALGRLLGEVSAAEDAYGRGMLSAVVVRKQGSGAGLPGAGFFVLARRLGRDVGDAPADRQAFWRAELERVFEAASGEVEQ
jgi:hypothetical protein